MLLFEGVKTIVPLFDFEVVTIVECCDVEVLVTDQSASFLETEIVAIHELVET
jgi:hypothetical protein